MKKQIRCENEYCIYQREEQCALRNIELDITGQCKSCILVKVENLEELKKRIIKKLYEDS